MTEPTEVVQALYESYNARSLDGWLTHFSDDAVWINVPTGERFVGRAGQETNYSNWNTPFPTGQCVDLVIRGGSQVVVAEFVGDGVNTGPLPGPDGDLPPTGKRVAIPFCDVHTVVGDRIVETHRYWDNAAVAEQMA